MRGGGAGPTGPTGPTRADGADGTDGVDGATGPTGPAGTNSTSSNPMRVSRLWMAAGTDSTTQSLLSKKIIGSTRFAYTDFLTASKLWTFRATLQTTSPYQSASIDLYDADGIIIYPPAQVVGSELSTSGISPTQLSVDLTALFNTITGSGVIEARLWMYPSGTVIGEHFVSCTEAYIEGKFT